MFFGWYSFDNKNGGRGGCGFLLLPLFLMMALTLFFSSTRTPRVIVSLTPVWVMIAVAVVVFFALYKRDVLDADKRKNSDLLMDAEKRKNDDKRKNDQASVFYNEHGESFEVIDPDADDAASSDRYRQP